MTRPATLEDIFFKKVLNPTLLGKDKGRFYTLSLRKSFLISNSKIMKDKKIIELTKEEVKQYKSIGKVVGTSLDMCFFGS